MPTKKDLTKKSLGILMHPSCIQGGRVCGTFGKGAKDSKPLCQTRKPCVEHVHRPVRLYSRKQKTMYMDDYSKKWWIP